MGPISQDRNSSLANPDGNLQVGAGAFWSSAASDIASPEGSRATEQRQQGTQGKTGEFGRKIMTIYFSLRRVANQVSGRSVDYGVDRQQVSICSFGYKGT
jgi:hypothetical protein